MLTKSQLALHWRLWSQVVKQRGLKGNAEQMDAHRHKIYAQALRSAGLRPAVSQDSGLPPSLTRFTNQDLDKVLAQFRLIISDNTHVASQVQLDHPELGEAKRRLHVIKRVQPKLLAVCLWWQDCAPSPGGEGRGEGDLDLPPTEYYHHAIAYIETIMIDRFHITEGVRPLEDLHLHELDMLRSTVARCIDGLRKKAGHTVHEMYQAAKLQCPPATACRKCAIAKLNHTQPAHA